MDTMTALKRLTDCAEAHIEADKRARTALAEALATAPATDLTNQIDAAFRESASAKPWEQLMKRVERDGVREGLAAQKTEVLDILLSDGMSMSTNMVANSARLAEQDGLRRFLDVVGTIDIDDDAPAGTKAAAAPHAAPAETPVPEATPAQKRTLQSIKEAGVTLQEFSAKNGIKVQTKPGYARPRHDLVEDVIAQGWAQRDITVSLFCGQAVTLTAVGEAVLAD
ncbi:hypothetical protein [Streptomyces sp. NRRL F-5053]|uniref:hypothetical protein n=1 Tax=Streptomyces sp. NRRL F-5053 TaxID=1463854 RepID=UPI0004CC0DA3|nr:hypothetical protein [Streptomyces sp. NRRL F-5053]